MKIRALYSMRVSKVRNSFFGHNFCLRSPIFARGVSFDAIFHALSYELFQPFAQRAVLELAILGHLAPVNHRDRSTFFQKVDPTWEFSGGKCSGRAHPDHLVALSHTARHAISDFYGSFEVKGGHQKFCSR